MIHETLFTFEAFESVWTPGSWRIPNSFSLEICQCGNYPHAFNIPGALSRFRII